ncbi:hypothetical protein BDB01DRAFT_722370, partial [Pilobolus umbonatus]
FTLGCRGRKKKCDGLSPCNRCQKLEVNCHYSQTTSPVIHLSHDSLFNQYELQLCLHSIENTVRDMEREMYSIQLSNILAQKQTPQSVVMRYNNSSKKENNPIQWKLSVEENGVLRIHTDILTYTALSDHLKTLSDSLHSLTSEPRLIPTQIYLQRHELCSLLRRGMYRVCKKSILSIDQRSGEDRPNKTEISTHYSHRCKQQIALKLVDIYFNCQIHHQLLFHQSTFYDLYVHPQRRTDDLSPAVYGLAAVVLTMNCNHISTLILPEDKQGLAGYFFGLTKQLITLQFDKPSLELLICYTHMARYNANVLRMKEARFYLDIALRIRHILSETDYRMVFPEDPSSRPSGEIETFKRLHSGLLNIMDFIEYTNNRRGVPVRKTKQKSSTEDTQLLTPSFIKEFRSMTRRYPPTYLPNEPWIVNRLIIRNQYKNKMADIVGPYFRQVRFSNEEVIPLTFLITVENKLNTTYHDQIPQDFQLSPTIFEKGLSETEFERRMSEDSRCDLISASLAASYYQYLLSIYEPFLPIILSRTLSPQLAQEMCTHYAVVVVRLLNYQCKVLNSCALPIAMLLSAWDIHLRNSCLGMTLEEIKNDHQLSAYLGVEEVNMARKYAVLCMDILKKGIVFNSAESEIYEYYRMIEHQLLIYCK